RRVCGLGSPHTFPPSPSPPEVPMLARFRDFFQTQLPDTTSQPLNEQQKRLACAALLIEVAVIDNEFDSEELASVKTILHREFDVPEEELDEMVAMAQHECSESTS